MIRGNEKAAELERLTQDVYDLLDRMALHPADGLRLEAFTELASRIVPGVEDAGISVREPGRRPRTVAPTGDLPERVDDLQYRLGEGPCVQAMDHSDVVWTNDLGAEGQWPTFGPRAVGETDVRSMLSCRLIVQPPVRAALNFYATQTGAFSEQSTRFGLAFAVHTSLALSTALLKDEVTNLRRAVESNREIGVAMGILMTRTLCTQEEAFERLRAASQKTNRKLREIAADVVLVGDLPEPDAESVTGQSLPA